MLITCTVEFRVDSLVHSHAVILDRGFSVSESPSERVPPGGVISFQSKGVVGGGGTD